MEHDRKLDEQLSRWRKLCEELVGGVAELEVEEADELLAAAHIDAQALRETMYQKLSAQARAFRARGESLPRLLEEALEDLRPEWAPARNEEELAKQAKSKITALLKPNAVVSAGQLSFAYRNKKDLSEIDKEFLDRIAKKLQEQIKPEGENK